ncbi:S8 family serine peptidase [Propionicimonas sp.]|uniref:S8 family serine peptidase n=1 Tax=Propionicimonas sp. TaxID=1955623 RepID=UPI001DA4F322|nr:S8 family serine peptidase [Propionicimonas sp.]MBU3976073.1 S8 family serine peptidase [Actinomycetota bacterium]MBU3985263.1 S8 family serine peptidase [Actinomycetota bacterium]MBU4008253.1 S8 family serine peptidase [Actinomycetota bacterium]MBU4064533.1 S8 family serine peptidase [Actinomycetota bacterium]MBU4094045.1 S8 family serine peptidase [Actinomycetota bacterium]
MRQRLLLAAATLGVGVLSVVLVVSAIPQVPAATPLVSEPPPAATAVNSRSVARIHSTNTDTVIVALRGKVANPAAAAVSAIRKAAWKVAGAKVVSSKALRADAATVTLNKSLTRKQADQIAAAAERSGGVRYAEASVKFYPTDAGGDDYYWNIDQINASAAWATANTEGAADVVVGVIDTGIADNALLPKALLVDTVDGFAAGATTVSGTTWPGLTVTVTYNITETATAIADSRGKWTATLVPEAENGTTLTASVEDRSGNQTTIEEIEVDSAVIEFTANASNGTIFTGTVEAGSTVILSYPDSGNTTEQAQVTGTDWTLTPNYAGLEHGQDVTVTATDRRGNVSTKQVIIDAELSTPTLTAYNEAEIAGTSDNDSTVTITRDEGGSAICEKLTPVDGKFSCVPDPELANDTAFTVTARDEAGNEATKTGVIDAVDPAMPEVFPSDGSQFSGTAENGSTVRLTYFGHDSGGSDAYDEVTASAAGGWSLSDPSVDLVDGDLVLVKASDSAGNVSPVANVTIDKLPPAAPMINATNGELVSGTGEAGAEVKLTYFSGRDPKYQDTTVTDQGIWSLTLDSIADDRSMVSARLVDQAGNESTSVSRRVHYGPPSAPAVAASNGEFVSVIGVDEAANPKLLDASSVEVVGAWTNLGAGAWKFVPETALTEADVVKVVVVDSDGVSSTPVTVTIDTTAPATPVITTAVPTNVYGTAEAGTLARITYRDAADAEQSAETVTDTNGDWVFDLDQAAAVGSDLTVKVTDAAGNSAQASGTIAEPTPAPSEDPSTAPGANSEDGEVGATVPDGSAPTELGDTKGSGTVLPGYDFVSDVRNTTQNADGTVSNEDADGDGPDADATDRGVTNVSWLTSHGTHVAGIVAANSADNPRLTGTAPAVKILPVRALPNRGGGDMEDVAMAIRWAAGEEMDGITNPYPADVLNLSLGGTGTCSDTLQDAIDYAVSQDTVVVVSAGNNNASIANTSPANCNNVIVVTAASGNGSRATYSNWGDSTTASRWLVAAPGGADEASGCYAYYTDPTQAAACTSQVVSTIGGRYEPKFGTSMAAPHVAGTAALLKSLDKDLTPAEIAAFIRGTATPLTDGCPTGTCGSGIVNAGQAVAAVAGGGVSPNEGGGSIDVNVPAAKYPTIWVSLPGTTPAVVGTTLTASSGSSYGTYGYQWQRRAATGTTIVAIPGATRRTYTLTAADLGQIITVKVTGVAGMTKTSNWIRPGQGTLRFTALPAISGKAKVGKKLTVKYAVAPAVSPVKATFQWYRSSGKKNIKISKATKSTYKLTKKDRGRRITVKVTLSAPGYGTISKTPAKKTSTVKR